ncbi:hypothetical protein PENSPDRAFT_691197 [Peniophora sp. CONT]|nr:hypothetical protein PENSPDRAFT_691197 [Peniophora sp. CONT]
MSEEVLRARRIALYHRRLRAASELPASVDPDSTLVSLVCALGEDGMSDTESDHVPSPANPNTNVSQLVVLPNTWRSRHCRPYLTALDDLYDISATERGQSIGPTRVFNDDRPRRKRYPVPRLPRNMYDDDWLGQWTESTRRALIGTRNMKPFEAPSAFWT